MSTPPAAGPPPAASSYLDYLPAIFAQAPFAGQFLLAFETMLTAAFWTASPIPPGPAVPPPAGQQPGLETEISHIPDYLDPATTRADFLPWLAGWVALTLRADWDEPTQRAFIAQIVSLYQLRGTLPDLQQMLSLYTGEPVIIWDAFDERPFFFEVQLTLTDSALLEAKRDIARAIIDQEKPAHTYYALQIGIPTMRLVSQALHDQEGVPLLILGSTSGSNISQLGTQIPGSP